MKSSGSSSHRPDIILGLVTGQTSKATSPTDHFIQDWRAAGLRVPSAFRTFIVTLPRSAVLGTMGSLAPADWQEVIARVNLAMRLS